LPIQPVQSSPTTRVDPTHRLPDRLVAYQAWLIEPGTPWPWKPGPGNLALDTWPWIPGPGYLALDTLAPGFPRIPWFPGYLSGRHLPQPKPKHLKSRFDKHRYAHAGFCV